MRQIQPYPLWLGHVGDARDLRRLFTAGIEALVDLAREEPPLTTHRELIYCRFPLEDGTDNSPAVLHLAVQTIAGLLTARVPTLVFCGAGMSRTPALAAAALALVVGREAEEWLERLKQLGPADVSPGIWQGVHAVWKNACTIGLPSRATSDPGCVEQAKRCRDEIC